jgi:predicted GNAT superfamily acetyltransferase
MADLIEIRPVTTLGQIAQMQQLEQAVWATAYPVTDHQLFTAAKNGGILLGAYHGQEMIGMLYSFPGYLQHRPYLYSHMLGIKAEWRSRGIGERLKLAQKEAAVSAGYDMITWTYDPLEGANAYLNIHKLGAVSRTYIVNCYGEMTDKLNAGLPSDRLQTEWWLAKRLSPQTQPTGAATAVLGWRLTSGQLPEPEQADADLTGTDLITVAVPAGFRQIKEQDIRLALRWRLALREVLARCFDAGWTIVDFCSIPDQPVNAYVLSRDCLLDLPPAPWRQPATQPGIM